MTNGQAVLISAAIVVCVTSLIINTVKLSRLTDSFEAHLATHEASHE